MAVKIDPSLGLPDYYTEWRDEQYSALQAITNSNKPFFLADFPTGVGKSLIGVGAQRMLKQNMIYLCGTKQLQDQILRDFPDIAVSLKGKGNYPCARRYDEFPEISCEDCTKSHPASCDNFNDCEYYQQKIKAASSPLVVLNNAYFLNEANGYNSIFSGSNILIADEVDAMDNALMGYVELKINSKQLHQFNLQPPERFDDKKAWVDWTSEACDNLDKTSRDLSSWLSKQKQEFESWGTSQIANNRLKKSIEKLSDKLSLINSDCDESWIFSYEQKKDYVEWVFKPVNIGRYANRYLWRHSMFNVGMSGTIFSADIMCRELGIHECDYMRLDSPFPVENRPIYYQPVCNLRSRHMNEELPKLLEQMEIDLPQYVNHNEKVLVHTVSYDIRNYLQSRLSCQDLIVTHESYDRDEALKKFQLSHEPLVMLSPSFDRGVDLREQDNVGCQMVCKMPYLSLGDPHVSTKVKLSGGWEWYFLKATQTLVQMTGRSIRTIKQKCDTRIYDEQFSKLRLRMAHIIPQWWEKAIIEVPVQIDNKRKLFI